MSNKRIEWGQELVSTANELSEAGVPGVGLLGKFAQSFYDRRLKKRFEKFLEEAHVDNAFIEEVLTNEEYSDCLYGALETVRRTHSKLGLSALARIYHLYWNDPGKIIPATRALAEISDAVVLAFVRLYREIEPPRDFLVLYYAKGEERYFHEDYAEAVDLIGRNIFLLSSYSSVGANMPIQGMKGPLTEMYYLACSAAIENG